MLSLPPPAQPSIKLEIFSRVWLLITWHQTTKIRLTISKISRLLPVLSVSRLRFFTIPPLLEWISWVLISNFNQHQHNLLLAQHSCFISKFKIQQLAPRNWEIFKQRIPPTRLTPPPQQTPLPRTPLLLSSLLSMKVSLPISQAQVHWTLLPELTPPLATNYTDKL